MPAISALAVIAETSPPPVQGRMKSAALPRQRDASGRGPVLPLGCRPATRRPTAIATATRADRGGRRPAAAPEASRSQTPMNGAELRKQSLKTEVTGPRGPETGLAVRPSRKSHAGRAASAACHHMSPTGLALHARWWPTRHLGVTSSAGGCWQSSAGVGSQIPYSTEARPRTAGGAVGAGYWGSTSRTLAA